MRKKGHIDRDLINTAGTESYESNKSKEIRFCRINETSFNKRGLLII
ncbi:hypothetical protein XBO1_500005 [Xenorhabdus bovienii str. oregonense]|uniref:Uncharacterized protein n=1 Tax=Xenorhabdus bovienii str. oregonense TaxID=1398202 RepID=A0A077PAJ2_XENBV|nr:hypothetical protein XBO1_500005 [Xenorhabdus bovienii str. oregonense]